MDTYCAKKRNEQIVSICLKHVPSILAIYLYGSTDGPFEKADSDLDIALLMPWNEDLDFEARDLLTIDLAETFSKKIDLVDLRKAGTILQKEAIMKGERLYASSPLEADRYEVVIMKSYQILSDERKDIIKEGIQSGRFYHE
jgi:uncharacterized protein